MKESAGKILIIVQNLPVPFDRRVWLESKTLTEHGYKVSVISPKSKEYIKSHEVIDDISIYRYRIPFEAEGKLSYVAEFLLAWLATAWLSLRVLWREGFDVIQACNPPDTYFLLGRIYKLFGKKFVYDHHDLCPEMFQAKFSKRNRWLYRLLRLLEKWSFRSADVVLSTNQSYREVAITRGGKKEHEIYVVRTGPDLKNMVLRAPDPSLKRGRRYLVCYLGEMCSQDGLEYLLRAIHHLLNHYHRTDTQFTLIGGGPAQAKLKLLCDRMGLNEQVLFTGRLPDDQVSRYLSTADVCVDPDPWSEWANLSTMNKILEYMAFAKPVVAFDLKEARYTAMRAALYAKPNNVSQFSEKINFLLNNPSLRREMGDFGRRRIIRELSWTYSVPVLLAAYQQVLDGAATMAPAAIEEERLLQPAEIDLKHATLHG